MSAKINGVAAPADASSAPPRKLKILMLHGYTQNGPLFYAKTRALEKALLKAFPTTKISPLFSLYPDGPQLSYPTAPIKLRPADIPGYSPPSPSSNSPAEEASDEARGWWIRDPTGGLYSGLETGLEMIREAIIEMGGIDGIIGFSQGACAATLIASLLDEHRESSFTSPSFPYPTSWSKLKADLNQGPLKFCVSYSGFYAPNEVYNPFYEPAIKTPVLNVIGSLDSVVPEEKAKGLAERCEEETRRVVYHPGGHFVPIGKDMVGALVGFIRECCKEETKEKEQSVEDMDVPF